MGKTATTFEARRVDIFVQQPNGGVVLQLVGEEDARMLLVIDQVGGDALAEGLFKAGFGKRGTKQ